LFLFTKRIIESALSKINSEKYIIVIYMQKIIIIGLLSIIIVGAIFTHNEPFINPSSLSTSYPSTHVLPTDESATKKSSCRIGYDIGLDKQCYRCSSGATIKQGNIFPSGFYCLGANGITTRPIQSN
jgi:hypothetical protein